MSKWFMIAMTYCLILAFNTSANSETLYLKSGEKVTGKIVGQSAKSVMIEGVGGAYKSYPTDEIKEIRKEDVAEEIPAQVVTPQGVASENKTIVKLKEGGVIKIVLPKGYTPIDEKELNSASLPLMFVKDTGKDAAGKRTMGGFFGINIFPIGMLGKEEIKKEAYDNKGFPSIYLDDFKRGIIASDNKCIIEDYVIFGDPAILTTHVTPKNKIIAIIFIKGNKRYQIDFSYKVEFFDKEWPIVEQSLKTMEIEANGAN